MMKKDIMQEEFRNGGEEIGNYRALQGEKNMIIIPKENTECQNCVWSTFQKGDSVLASGNICRLNPFKPIGMGLFGKHADRKAKILEEKETKKGSKQEPFYNFITQKIAFVEKMQ